MIFRTKSEMAAKLLNVLAKKTGRFGGFVHFSFEVVNVGIVILERGADETLEVVDLVEIGKEGKDVFDLEEFAMREKFDSGFQISSDLNDITCDFQPKLFSEFVVILGEIGVLFGEFKINTKRHIYSLRIQAHRRVD